MKTRKQYLSLADKEIAKADKLLSRIMKARDALHKLESVRRYYLEKSGAYQDAANRK
jgi:hypothetical protein